MSTDLHLVRGGRRKPRKRYPLSSTHDALVGRQFDGYRIRRVEKLPGSKRRFVVEGHKPILVDRATLHELMKARGWVMYRQKLEQATDPAEKRAIIKASLDRQRAILARQMAREAEGAAVAPPHVRKAIERRIHELARLEFGSPILGDAPATRAVPPHYGPAKTFATLKRSDIRFITVGKGKRRRVIPLTR